MAQSPALKRALGGLKPETISRWRLYDAKDQVLGRLASHLSVVLQGKDKPTYSPNLDDGDVCIVVNARAVALTGNKLTDKKYYWHTGYIGGIKERTVKAQMERDCTEVIRKAVLRMLPRNRLTDDRMRKLRIYEGEEHPYADFPVEACEPPPRNCREFTPRQRRAAEKASRASGAAGGETSGTEGVLE